MADDKKQKQIRGLIQKKGGYDRKTAAKAANAAKNKGKK